MHTAPPSLLETFFTTLQSRILAELEAADGTAFRRDPWQRPDGTGHGLTCVIEGGQLFERGGINFSRVSGERLPASATARRPDLAGRAFTAMGVSLVLHPRNPYCPTSHMNVRCFYAHPRAAGDAPVCWFGGGMDLTPYYPFDEDCRHFHQTCKDAVTQVADEATWRRFKNWCDEYFFLPHRNEPRGIGGLFFDDYGADGTPDFDHAFALTRAVGEAFPRALLPILERRRATPYGEREREFQALRRARYVEFNLLQDRGTLFGIQSKGRTESILMSMPPTAAWRYDWHPEPGTPEAALYAALMPPRDWV